jgi:aminobenzoyl-glutamate utilization protein B
MKKLKFISLVLFLFPAVLVAQKGKTKKPVQADVKQELIKSLDSKYDYYKERALQIWDYAEIGYKEEKSSALLQQTLKDNGFSIEAAVAGMPTAFVAAYGSGSPVIGILAEFDALPGLSQTNKPEKEVNPLKEAGHGCGHHLFGVASVAAGIEIKNLLEQKKISGTIKVYGTPAEEGGSGKVYMVREGLFAGVDIVLHWHPGDKNSANAASSLANMSAKFRFLGISAHAAGAPEKGRSALDGVEAMNYMVNMMREHIPSETRIHYVITRGGNAPNVVPDFAEVYYYARHPDRGELARIFERIVKAADGAAAGTETKTEYEIVGAVFNLLPVESLAKLMHANLTLTGGVTYNENEIAFGKKIQESLIGPEKPALTDAAAIEPFKNEGRSGGSTDVGDVSWVVPTVGLRIATWVPGTAAHSWQAVACGGTEIGTKGMIVAAKTLALTGFDLFTNPQLIQAAKEEWNKLTGEKFVYKPLLGNRKPALNYRD